MADVPSKAAPPPCAAIGLSLPAGGFVPADPTRDVRHRVSSCTTGAVPVPVTGDAMRGEGRLDIDFQLLVSVLPWVRTYQPQPQKIPIVVDGTRTFYTPDGRLTGLSRPLNVEIKPWAKLRRSPDLDGRKLAIKHALAAKGEDFAILTEREIRGEPLFSNARLVWSKAQNLAKDEVIAACDALQLAEFSTMECVVTSLGGGHGAWRLALGLVGMKVLAIDLGRTIASASPVRAGPRGWI